MQSKILSIIFAFLFLLLVTKTLKTTENDQSKFAKIMPPKINGLYEYNVIFSNATMLRGNQFIQLFNAFNRLNVLKMGRVDDGTDFSNFIDPEIWAKFKGQFITFGPYSVENVEAIGHLNGTFFGAIYSKNDSIYIREVPKNVRKVPEFREATAIVYKNSKIKPFGVVGSDVFGEEDE